MASITISVDDKAITNALHELQSKVINLEPVMEDIGQILMNSTRDRFEQGIDPTGKPWVTLQPWYQKQKKKNKNLTLVLNHDLMNSINPQATSNSVTIGTNRKYAAMHQFGGVVGKGSPFAGKEIKARPFLGISNDDKENILDAVLDHMAAAWR